MKREGLLNAAAEEAGARKAAERRDFNRCWEQRRFNKLVQPLFFFGPMDVTFIGEEVGGGGEVAQTAQRLHLLRIFDRSCDVHVGLPALLRGSARTWQGA